MLRAFRSDRRLMGCAVVSAVAPPAAVPLGREPQMRVLVQEGQRLALRADGTQLFRCAVCQGVPARCVAWC